MSTTVRLFLTALENVRKDGTGHNAKCPAHPDDKNSLHIAEGEDGRVLLHCHAGCRIERIVHAAGRSMTDLFPATARAAAPGRKGGRGFGDAVATYDYVDEDGHLLFQVQRDADKNFRQRRPSNLEPPADPWIYSLQDVRRVLYRLPEVRSAVAFQRSGKFDQPIFIVEGEKDADALIKLGLVATTNSGGAGKWTDDHTRQIAGAKKVILLPDNDDPGRRHARAVTLALRGKVERARTVRLPDLPEKGDVSDWIASGGTKRALMVLCEAPPRLEGWISARKLLETPIPDIDWIVAGIVSRPSIAILSGDSGVWKSWTGTDLAIAMSTGSKFLCKFSCNGSRVMLVTADEDAGEARRKISFLCAGARLTDRELEGLDRNFVLWIGDLDFDDDEQFGKLEADVADFAPDLVIVDHIRVCFEGDENSSVFARAVKRRARAIIAAHPCCVLWHHHWRKQSKEKEMNTARQRARGSSGLVAICDHHLAIERTTDGVARFVVDKNRKGRELAPFQFVPRILESEGTATLEYQGEVVEKKRSRGGQDKVLQALHEGVPVGLTSEEIQKRTGLKKTAVSKHLGVLHAVKVDGKPPRYLPPSAPSVQNNAEAAITRDGSELATSTGELPFPPPQHLPPSAHSALKGGNADERKAIGLVPRGNVEGTS